MTSPSRSEVPACELRNFVEKSFTDRDASDICGKVISKLQDLGVYSFEDLKFLQECDLQDVLKPVQIRKFLHLVQKHQEVSSPTCSTSKQSSCTESVGRPEQQFNPKLFSLQTVLERLPGLGETLQNGNRLPADIRRDLVREVVNCVRNISHHCPKKEFEEIARSLVQKYPNSLEDRIDKIRIGTGYDSLLKQFISRNKNLNRPYLQLKTAASSSSSDCGNSSDKVIKVSKRKQQEDSYGCVNWGPSISPEDEDKQDKIRKEMLDCYGSAEPEWDSIYSKMEVTYPLLRKHINSGAYISNLLEDWPFLIESNVLISHCQQLLGIDLAKAAENFFLKKGTRMLRFFRSRIPDVRPYVIAAEKEKEENNLAAILPLVILCLQTSLGEKESSLFAVVDEMSSNEEVKDQCSEKSWPRLVMMGKSVLAATRSILVVDGQIIGRFTNFLTATALLFGAYYIFNIQYPKEAAGTLEFIQRCCMGINPGSGAKSTKRKKTSAVNPKVLKLINDLADFEWTDELQ